MYFEFNISVVVIDVEFFFFLTCLRAIHMSFLKKCLFRSSSHFSLGLFVCLFFVVVELHELFAYL